MFLSFLFFVFEGRGTSLRHVHKDKYTDLIKYLTQTHVCMSAMTLKWHNNVNSKYIAIQFYMRADTP